jgi:hypothetical protein
MADPTSRQRGRPKNDKTETLKKNLWSKVPYLSSTPRHTDWLTVSRKVTLTLTLTWGITIHLRYVARPQGWSVRRLVNDILQVSESKIQQTNMSYHSTICLEGVRYTTKVLGQDIAPVEIRNGNLLNMSQKRHCLGQLAGWWAPEYVYDENGDFETSNL